MPTISDITVTDEAIVVPDDDGGLPFLGILKPDGTPWRRYQEVTDQILTALTLSHKAVVVWAERNRTRKDALKEEAIVHLIRHYNASGDTVNPGHLLAVLWGRCTRTLDRQFRDMDVVEAEQARDRVMDIMARLIYESHSPTDKSSSRTAKYLEINFGQVFTSRIRDQWRHLQTSSLRHAPSVSLSIMPEVASDSGMWTAGERTTEVERLVELAEAFRVIMEAGHTDKRVGAAYILHHYQGMSRVNIAKEFDVTPATITRWLKLGQARIERWRKGDQ
jgi:DNA-directed RNA polymerase specialized sigma24 family protein